MEVIRDKEYDFTEGVVVTFGKFDGIHRGHKRLIDTARQIADEKGLEVVVFTLLLDAGSKWKKETLSLTTSYERAQICKEYGVDKVVEYSLDESTSNLKPMQFLEKVVKDYLHASYVVVGKDWHFGKGAAGDVTTLKACQKLYNYTAVIIPKELEGGREISSTWVRSEVAAGNMENANILLGHPYRISGMIEHGRALGRQMDYPTINLIPDTTKLMPPYGVYASKVYIEDEQYYGVTNIGIKPTVTDEGRLTVETNVFDFDEDVYDKMAIVELCSFERPEMKFDNIEALKRQLSVDADFAKNYFLIS